MTLVIGRVTAARVSGLLVAMTAAALCKIAATPAVLLAALWTAGLLAARDRDAAPPLALALLMTLWANMHGGFVFGLALIAPFAGEAVLAARPGARLAAARGWAVFGCAAVTAALVNP